MPLAPHFDVACLNAGDEGLTPAGGELAPPVPPLPVGNVGSGNSGTPCVRMHCANSSACRFCWAVSGGGGPPPPGSSLAHALAAASNAGPLNVMPSAVSVSVPGLVASDRPGPPGPFVGSGKFLMPCECMQCDSRSGEFALGLVAAAGL